MSEPLTDYERKVWPRGHWENVDRAYDECI